MSPEWARPLRIDTIGDAPREVTVEADAQERTALAARLGIEGIEALAATASVRKNAVGVIAEGSVRAQVVQRCVATGRPLAASIEAPFRLCFTPTPVEGAGEIELEEGELDTLPLEDGAIDLGEAAAETLSLALDPYPRAPDADQFLRSVGIATEDTIKRDNPFAGLREKLQGGE